MLEEAPSTAADSVRIREDEKQCAASTSADEDQFDSGGKADVIDISQVKQPSPSDSIASSPSFTGKQLMYAHPSRPAACALTHVNVIAKPRSASDVMRPGPASPALDTTRSYSQSVKSGTGNFRATWKDLEGSHTDSSSDESGEELVEVHRPSGKASQAPPPDKIRSKLARWSWDNDSQESPECPTLRIHGSDSRFPSGDEGFPAPPNTGKSSLAASREASAPESQASSPDSSRQSYLCTAGATASSGPAGLGRSISSPSVEKAASSGDISPFGNLTRQLSAGTQRKPASLTRRDSLDVYRQHLASNEGQHKTNPLLASTRDSLVLAKGRLEKYPRGQKSASQSAFSRLKIGNLSPIPDASPPDTRSMMAARSPIKSKLTAQSTPEARLEPTPQPIIAVDAVEVRGHSAADHGCPIYQVERPRATAREVVFAKA